MSMTTPEQRLFAAQQVYPGFDWAQVHEGKKSIAYRSLGEFSHYFDPENNADQWRDMWRWLTNRCNLHHYSDGMFNIRWGTNQKYIRPSLEAISDTEALILAVCALGGFEDG